MSDNELLPCPFCGGSVTLERIESRAGEWHGIICRNTANRGGSCAYECHPSRTPEAAAARWNMRSGYTAVAMATAAADGFRDGAASNAADANRYQHIKSTWNDGALLDRLKENTLPEDWDAAIDADMGKEG